MVVETFFSHLL